MACQCSVSEREFGCRDGLFAEYGEGIYSSASGEGVFFADPVQGIYSSESEFGCREGLFFAEFGEATYSSELRNN